MISIVLVNWNSWGDTISCIQSILNSNSGYARIIVVDNNSSDCSIEVFKKWSEGKLNLIPMGDDIEYLSYNYNQQKNANCEFYSYESTNSTFLDLKPGNPPLKNNAFSIHFVESNTNGGFGYGCNVGIKLGEKLGSSAYWLLNNDCVVNPEVLSLVSEKILKHPNTIFGTILKFYYNPSCIQAVGGGNISRITGRNMLQDKLPLQKRLDFIHGASIAFSSECISKVGKFDEHIFMYFEEIDYCLRARSCGYCFDVIYTDVYHKHGGSQGKVPTVKAWSQVLTNKHYVLKKHFGWGVWMIFFYTSLLLRCSIPAGEKNARLGARQALKQLILDGASL